MRPFSQELADFQQRLSKFRRALRSEDQRAFDALMEKARLNTQAGVYAAAPDPAQSILLAMLIAECRRSDALETRLQVLEQRLAELKQPPETDDDACRSDT